MNVNECERVCVLELCEYGCMYVSVCESVCVKVTVCICERVCLCV